MRIPRVNCFSLIFAFLVILGLCYILDYQEKTIAKQQRELRAVVILWQEAQSQLETPCEERDRDYRPDPNQTLLANR